MLDLRLYLAQRVSAVIMIPLALGHLATMIIAAQVELTAAGILGRTQGSVFWFAFYGIFVLAVSIHAAIGLRVIVYEWTGLNGRPLALLTWGAFALLFLTGARAVLAVTLA